MTLKSLLMCKPKPSEYKYWFKHDIYEHVARWVGHVLVLFGYCLVDVISSLQSWLAVSKELHAVLHDMA